MDKKQEWYNEFEKETRNIEIENVGICDVTLPFIFMSEREYSTISQISSGVFVDPLIMIKQ